MIAEGLKHNHIYETRGGQYILIENKWGRFIGEYKDKKSFVWREDGTIAGTDDNDKWELIKMIAEFTKNETKLTPQKRRAVKKKKTYIKLNKSYPWGGWKEIIR